VHRCASQTLYFVTAEEHSVYNGHGSAVADALSQTGSGARQLKIGLNDEVSADGPYDEVPDYHGLSSVKIAERVLAFIND